MWGTLLTLMDTPLHIENGGFFVAGGGLICLTTGVIIALCLYWLKAEFEEVALAEAEQDYLHSRMREILHRVELDRGILC